MSPKHERKNRGRGAGQEERRQQTEVARDKRAEEDAKAAADEIVDELDDILDDIDEVLEENAEEFLKGYVQKGGE